MFEIKQAQIKIRGLYILLTILLVIALFSGGLQIYTYVNTSNRTDNSISEIFADPLSATPELILQNFKKIYNFPEDEDPTIADIVDVEQLKVQNFKFYKEAKSGDKIIIFNKARLAIIFRIQENKIIAISPIAGNN